MTYDDAEAPLLARKPQWRSHWVNGTGFTISMATSAVIFTGIILLGASMLVAGTAKETNKLLPPVSDKLRTGTYGEKHAGVGFANYVVGNAVSSFWQKEMGKKGAKMTDPFASFLLKPKAKLHQDASAQAHGSKRSPAVICTGKGRCISDTPPDDEKSAPDAQADAQVVM